MPESADDQTILIADDDPMLLELMGQFLETRGWLALVAGDGEEALRIVNHYPDAIDLLITDVVMPGMDGFTLAAHVVDRRPGIKILYVSGYFDENEKVRHGLREAGRFFLRKPFGQTEFLDMVAAALQEPVDATDAFAVILGHPLVTAQAMKDWREGEDAAPRNLRYQLKLPLRFRLPKMTRWEEGTTQDVSRTGVLFATTAALPDLDGQTGSTPIDLRLSLPSAGVRSAEVACHGEIARVSPRTSPDGPVVVAVAVRSYHADIRR